MYSTDAQLKTSLSAEAKITKKEEKLKNRTSRVEQFEGNDKFITNHN